MKGIAVEYDEKTHSFSVDHNNILKEHAKDFSDSLIIKPFQIAVQVAFEKSVVVSDPKAISDIAEEAAYELSNEAFEVVEGVHTKLAKLKKEEDAGNKKAAAEGEKEVKNGKKQLDKLADEFGGKIRVTIENALKKSGQKAKGRSSSRSVVRGLDLNEDFFDEEADGEESSPYFGKLASGLAASGKELAKLTKEEGNQRGHLALAVERLQQTIDKANAGKKEVDIREFAKANPKDVKELEAAAEKYAQHIATMAEKIEAAEETLRKFEKLIDNAENLESQAQIEKDTGEYSKALDTVAGTMPEKQDAAKTAQKLFKDEYKDGSGWTRLINQLGKIKAAAKSGGILQERGAQLEKLSK